MEKRPLITNRYIPIQTLINQIERFGQKSYKKIRLLNKHFCKTSSPKGNNAHLRAIIQCKKKWKHQFFRRLRAANSVVHSRIWPNFKLIQALMYVIISCMRRITSRTTEKKWQNRFSNYNTICCHGNQC